MTRLKATPQKLRFRALGGLVTIAVGLCLVLVPDNAFQRMSFDLPFQWRSSISNTNAIIIYFNQNCLDELFQTNDLVNREAYSPPLRTNMPPDRRIYAPLLDALANAGARLVFFDCIFSESRTNEDGLFAAAVRRNKDVVIGGTYDTAFSEQLGGTVGLKGRSVVPPNPTLKAAVTNWGILAVEPDPADGVIRRMFTLNGESNSAVFLAATRSGFSEDAETERWINYYGPSPSIDSMLLPDALRPGNESRFRGKAVFIGGNDPSDPDLHLTPYSSSGISGTEILATEYLNLIQGDSLTRLNVILQGLLMVVWGVMAIAFFLCFRTRYIFCLVPICIIAPAAVGFFTQWEMHHWWYWTVCSFVQTPIAAGCAIIANRWYPWPPAAFISYRRVEGEGSGYAHAVWSALELHGFGAICDVKADLRNKKFWPQLERLIDSVPNFVLVVSKDALVRINDPDDYLREEIRLALTQKKNIISVLINSDKWPKVQLPPDIREVSESQCAFWRDEDPSVAIEKIVANLRQPTFAMRLSIFKGSDLSEFEATRPARAATATAPTEKVE